MMCYSRCASYLESIADNGPTMNEPIPVEASAMTPAMAIDLEHLKLLAIFHYIIGGMTILFSCFFLIYVGLGLVIFFNPEGFPGPPARPDQEVPPVVPIMMIVFGGAFVLLGWIAGGLTIYSGLCMQRRQRRTLSLVVAALQCLWVPIGTILGVFTIVVLMRDSIRRLYGEPI